MTQVTGWYVYKGTTTLQHQDVGEKFKKLFETTIPSQVLEIGTSYGGLTLLIRDLLDEVNLKQSTLRTYDVIETGRYWLEHVIQNGANIDLRVKNVFNHIYDGLVEEEEIKSFIQQSGPTIVLCDGGSKKNEFRILAPYLKKGDVIMAHDYAPNLDFFNEHINNKVWNWLEIQDSDIQETADQYQLEPFMQEEFQKVVWVCKIKTK
jgi:hypothetical protein